MRDDESMLSILIERQSGTCLENLVVKMVSFRRVYLISKKKRKKCSIFLNRIHDRKDIKIIILFWRQKVEK